MDKYNLQELKELDLHELTWENFEILLMNKNIKKVFSPMYGTFRVLLINNLYITIFIL